MKISHHLLITGFLLCSALGFAQDKNPRIYVKKINQNISLDGKLDEKVWSQADAADDFWQYFPTDSIKSPNRTSLKMLYNKEFLYLGIEAKTIGNDYAVTSLRRDFRGSTNDNISFLFDTFSDGTNAYLFGVTPLGVMRELLVSGGGADFSSFNSSWDIKWDARTTQIDGGYFIEIAIPFSSLKFPEGTKTWRFQTYRFDLQSQQRSIWTNVPQNQIMANLAFFGTMEFEETLGKNPTPIYFIPYVNTLFSKDFVTGTNDNVNLVGADAKIAVSNGLNLDVTVNPDFSNVEVDNIVTNLTRFELSLPEKRQFFIENSDLFANYGSSGQAQPFFSRRIGIVRDSLGNNLENRIIGGLRLNGKIGQNWRLGAMSLQSSAEEELGLPSYNNAMLSIQRRVFSRSNLGFFMVNKQSAEDYNRVIGLDYDLATSDNTWVGKIYLHKSFEENSGSDDFSTQILMNYNSRNWNFSTDWMYVGSDFEADLGFVPRKGIFKNANSAAYTIYPKNGPINTHTIALFNENFFKPELDWKNTDESYILAYEGQLRDQSQIGLEISRNSIFLINDFDPSRGDFEPLPGNTTYNFSQVNLIYQTNNANLFTFQGETSYGAFFNGTKYSIRGTLGYRFQPIANISLLTSYDYINLPEPYAQTSLILISPKIDLTFTKNLFWSTLIQYSNQQENLGINSRLQWRFAPMSDFFLVYNDSYQTDLWAPKFRSVNLKLSYWLNI